MANPILDTGMSYVGNIATKVNNQLDAISLLDPKQDEFQKLLLQAQTQLDALKKMMDAVEQAVRSFHRP